MSAFLVILLFPVSTLAQRDSSRNDFVNAESWFLFEDYNEAEFIYQKLLGWDPDNDNLKYKIGICLLNDPYRKEQSIDYLLQASNNINPAYKESSFKERTAPPDVLYYLGNAYLVNEMLDPAIESFRRFLGIMDPEIYDEVLVRAQIKACENAKRLMKMPVDLDLHPLGATVNTRYSESHPVISGDGKRMAFVTAQPFFDEALFIEKLDTGWSLPMSLTAMLGFDQDIYPVALSHDGTELLLYYDDEHIGNLYLSRYEDGFWLPAQKLGENITTKYWESHACFTRDGQTLYFTSNRKGTHGGLDIYKSERLAGGGWGIPENLGPTINSRYNEETPFITEDGQTLYFSSYGHFNMGGYDIFYSTRDENGNWGEPVNLGYPINTTDDDLFFHPVNNGFGGYQSRYVASGQGRHDLYYMDIYSVNNPRMYVVTGFVRTEDGETDLTTLEMFVIDPETGDTIKYSIPIDESGAFSLNLTQGTYALHFVGEGYEELIRPLSITTGSNKEGITLDDVIELTPIPKEPLVFEGEESLIQLKDSVYEGVAGEPLIIPLRLEKGATLVTRVFQDSVLVSVDTMEVEKRRTEIKINPLPGESRVELEMIDANGNIHKKTFTVLGTEPAPVVPRKERKSEDKAVIQPVTAGPVGLLVTELQEESEGALQETLTELDPVEEGISTPREVFEHLYEQSDEGDFSKEDVDLLLARTISQGDTELLYLQLLENSEGPLKEYLEGLDLEKEGINTPEELIRHLEEVAEANGFTMDDVREAMLKVVEQYTGTGVGIYDDPVGVMKLKLLRETDGTLHELLDTLDTEKQGITTRGELFEYLYRQADDHDYTTKEVDKLLIDALVRDDVQLLLQYLLENAEDPLKEYLENLDLEAEGIHTPGDLIKHLEQVAEENGFTMDQVRAAMTSALDHPLEVDRIYKELLETSDGAIKEILDGIHLRRDGIYTVEELITTIYDALVERGYSSREIEKILAEMFPTHTDFIEDLVRSGDGDRKGVPLAIGGGVIAFVLLLILLWFRRRKNEE